MIATDDDDVGMVGLLLAREEIETNIQDQVTSYIVRNTIHLCDILAKRFNSVL
jgi:hypothetical protein